MIRSRPRNPTSPLPSLPCRVGEVELPGPVMTASGTAGLGTELAPFVELDRLGAVVVKSLSSEPWAGNPSPRLAPVPGGMLNSVGLQNPGIRAWTQRHLPALAASGARVVVSIWGSSAETYRRAGELVAEARRSPAGAALVAAEINISCPNVEDRSRMFGHSADGVLASVGAAVAGLGGCGLPTWAKLSPNVTDLVAMARAAIEAGASGLTLVNTVMGMAIDPRTGRPRLGNGGGGLSGPAVHPVAVRAVFDCRAALPGVPIVGVGGVVTGTDAAELIAAGADAVQVGTATFADPRAPGRVLAELRAWCRDHDVEEIDDLKGRAHV